MSTVEKHCIECGCRESETCIWVEKWLLCNACYKRLTRHGKLSIKRNNVVPDNLSAAARHLIAESVETVCYSIATRCWEIPSALRARTPHGYVPVTFRKRMTKAHRLIVEAHYGPFTAEAPHALHRCDNTSCIRPTHLFRGSHQDNMRDRDAKGRQQKGERHAFTKLSDADCMEIHRIAKHTCLLYTSPSPRD